MLGVYDNRATYCFFLNLTKAKRGNRNATLSMPTAKKQYRALVPKTVGGIFFFLS